MSAAKYRAYKEEIERLKARIKELENPPPKKLTQTEKARGQFFGKGKK